MNVVIWVPFRSDGDDYRDRNLDLVLDQVSPFAEERGWKVVCAAAKTEPFSIAASWNLCAARSGDWDWAVRWGADFLLVDPTSVDDALATGYHHTHCFDKVSTLNRVQTKTVYNDGPGPNWPLSRLPFGGVSVISRELFETVGGYDERFKGWGHEDRAFVHAGDLLMGPRRRVPGHMLNLWHPKKEDRPNDPYFQRRAKNRLIWDEYRTITSPSEMRVYLENREVNSNANRD